MKNINFSSVHIGAICERIFNWLIFCPLFLLNKLQLHFYYMFFQKLLFVVLFFPFYNWSIAQQKDTATVHEDTTVTAFSLASRTLDSVTVTAFNLQSSWQDAPAAIAVVTPQQLQLLNNVSLVPVLNTVPGVRMEERSPGSYRLSVRGSLLRSPFGVRNVKVYWNDIPLTDAGGNTYLQLVDISQIQSLEIIKGPASSLYGANTGGAVILHSGNYFTPKTNTYKASVSGASYGLLNEQAAWMHNGKNFKTSIQQTHLQSDGYREHSAMRRDMIKWDGSWQISDKEKLSFISFYSDLYYQTPGGLTASQLGTDTTAYPKAILQKAAVYNKTIFAGASLASTINRHFDNTTTLTANHTSFKNPFTTNYELRDEWNSGGRTVFTYHTETKNIRFKWLAGAELLYNHSHIDDYDNNEGVKAAVQFKDELYATQQSFFTQINLQWTERFTAQAGISSNQQIIKYKRLTDSLQNTFVKSKTSNLAAPRISLLYKVVGDVNVYAVAAKGFSPPSLQELHPSNGTFNDSLQPEYGWNFELGIKGNLLQNRLQFDASAYSFRLRNAIVRRSTDVNPEYYVNAGSTRQQGIEVWMRAWVIKNETHFINSLAVSNSYSFQPYTFTSYMVADADYSGNRITGVPRNINVSTVEIESKPGFYANVILNNTSSIPLTDANDAFADAYHLLQCKIGYHHRVSNHYFQYNIFIGGDNLLNEAYSLGNDINAFGKRYYNPAPKRNFFAGVQVLF
ncbi:TonB-dependent receptor [Ilyomonas limi]|uniref:TonB-dependent receptor n=1 Tax=Ilyomonas limi TaxID=2575867 RepID=A0A4U3KVN3_9BACT|nr:TonB-dependent receptor [Ilyomonas limi]TKK66412.1 TonB-dependent receptor [Ilyomonas limi]